LISSKTGHLTLTVQTQSCDLLLRPYHPSGNLHRHMRSLCIHWLKQTRRAPQGLAYLRGSGRGHNSHGALYLSHQDADQQHPVSAGRDSISASEPPADLGCCAGAGLVVRWSWLHGTRSLFPLVGAVVDSRGIPSRSRRAVESDQHGSIRNQLCPKARPLCWSEERSFAFVSG
jgi:hypothetical protein